MRREHERAILQDKAPKGGERCCATFWSDDLRGRATSFLDFWCGPREGTALLPTALVFVSNGFVLHPLIAGIFAVPEARIWAEGPNPSLQNQILARNSETPDLGFDCGG